MKYKTDNSQTAPNTATARGMKFHLWLPLIASVLVHPNATAAVQVTRFDPPLSISAFAEVAENLLLNVVAFDFNVDGEVDYRLASGFGFIAAYFNHPARFGRREGRSGVEPVGGPVAAVPLCSIIGSNIVSSVNTNRYVWSPGYTNRYDLTQPLGNHEAGVITANVSPHGFLVCPIISISTNGTLVTNCFHPGPIVSGDVAGEEAVMALEFYINGQLYYGYIHFDFRSPTDLPFGGASGVIHGWAYETEPRSPIQAVPLSPGDHRGRHRRSCGADDDRGKGHSPH